MRSYDRSNRVGNPESANMRVGVYLLKGRFRVIPFKRLRLPSDPCPQQCRLAASCARQMREHENLGDEEGEAKEAGTSDEEARRLRCIKTRALPLHRLKDGAEEAGTIR